MCNWGQTPFAHAKESEYYQTKHVQKGSVPNCTFSKNNNYEKVILNSNDNDCSGKSAACRD